MGNKRTVAAVATLGLVALLPLTAAKGAPGTPADGDSTTACSDLNPGTCTKRTMSSDGSRVVFASEATNLVAGDTNGRTDIFLARVAPDGSHTLARISVPDPASGGTGTQANAGSATPTISPSGEWVAFESNAGNLVGGDDNDVTDVFLYHVPTARLTRASVGHTGAEADEASFSPSVADNGSVAFTSGASNLVASAPPFEAVYVRRKTPAGTLTAAPGANGPSGQPSISPDGSRVVFVSDATNLGSAEDPRTRENDVFLWTVGAGVARVTTDAGAEAPSLRPDGKAVAFSSSSDLFDGDGLDDIVISPITGGDTLVVANCSCAAGQDRPALAPFLSIGVLAFQSAAPIAAPVGSEQVWARDAQATLSLLSRAPNGPLPNGASGFVSLSNGGDWAVFTSAASNLVPGDSNGATDVFLRHRLTGPVIRLSERPAGGPGPLAPPTTSTTTSRPVAPYEAPPAPAFTGVVRTGYWMLDSEGHVYAFGTAQHLGDPVANLGNTHAADLEPTPSGNGYWVVDRRGRVFGFGDAVHHGNAERGEFVKDEKVTSISSTATGAGYWLFTTRGRVLAHGDAVHYGDVAAVQLNGPVLDSIPTASGRGYYMVASDGGIFTFGDARFYGSLGNLRLNAPVQSLVPDGDGVGYWLVAADGGVFTFETPFRGSMGDRTLNKPVTGMVPFGNGYLMVAEDGGIFNFSNLPFLGSLGDRPPPDPVISVAPR